MSRFKEYLEAVKIKNFSDEEIYKSGQAKEITKEYVMTPKMLFDIDQIIWKYKKFRYCYLCNR